MDLALESGWSDEYIGAMSNTQFLRWQKYAATRMFPSQRLELYLMQVAMIIGKVMGGSKASLQDYVIERKATGDDEDNLEAAKEAFGFKPRIVKG